MHQHAMKKLRSLSLLLCLLISFGTNTNSFASAIKFNPPVPQPVVSDAQVDSAISAIDKLAQKQIDEKVVPGLAIAIVHNDKVVFAKGFGVREVGKDDKVDADTVFQLASVSKSLASTVVAGLVADGKISWDSKISELDPGFAMYVPWVTSQITVRDLFAHRSGLPDHAGDLLEDIGYDREQILYRLRYQKPDSSFRSGYAYTNFGLSEAAFAAAKHCNTNWEDVSQERLFKPLGMNASSYRFSDFMSRPNKAMNHVLVNGKWEHKFQREPDAQAPAGGASSSVNDLTKWMRLQINGGNFEGNRLIAEKALAESHHPHMLSHMSPLNGLPEFYGLGFNVSYDMKGRLRLGHSGGFSRGAATNFSLIPAEKLGICVLTNAYPIGLAEGLATTFTDLALNGKTSQDWLPLFKQVMADPAALGIIKGPDYGKPPASATAALNNSAYTGTYTNDFYGDLAVVVHDGKLILQLGPKKLSFPMAHYDRDIFTYDAETEDLSGIAGIRFTIGADGQATSVLVENLDADKQGSFTLVQPAK